MMKEIERNNPIHPKETIFPGIAQGILVDLTTYPFWTIKVLQQLQHLDRVGESSFQVGKRVFSIHGIEGFYRGCTLQMGRTALKQFWSVPIISSLPINLESKGLKSTHSLLITGIALSAIGAFFTPLDKITLKAVTTQKVNFVFLGWNGAITNGMRQFVGWEAFLLAEDYFSAKYRKDSKNDKLTMFQLLAVGFKTSCVVSLVKAPIDMANTIKLAQNIGWRSLFSAGVSRAVSRSCRGLLPQFTYTLISTTENVIFYNFFR